MWSETSAPKRYGGGEQLANASAAAPYDVRLDPFDGRSPGALHTFGARLRQPWWRPSASVTRAASLAMQPRLSCGTCRAAPRTRHPKPRLNRDRGGNVPTAGGHPLRRLDLRNKPGGNRTRLPERSEGRGADGRDAFRRGPSRPGRNRTCNPRFWRPVLYQLSYGPRR